MATRNGSLLWNRMRLTLEVGNNDIDTGITQPSLAFPANEPPLGIAGTAAPVDGATPASRVMVQPLADLAKWTDVTHGEPWYDTTTGTVHVQMRNAGKAQVVDLNVLFWDPHTSISPGEADTYNAVDIG